MFFVRWFQAELVESGTKVIGPEQYMGTTMAERLESAKQQQLKKIHLVTRHRAECCSILTW
jgi:hypothetical protein